MPFFPTAMHKEEQEMKTVTLEAAAEEPKHFVIWFALWIVAIAALLRALA
jgi:hypothetical protein